MSRLLLPGLLMLRLLQLRVLLLLAASCLKLSRRVYYVTFASVAAIAWAAIALLGLQELRLLLL